MRKNALQILIPKYGLEGTIYLSGKNAENVKFVHNEEVINSLLIHLSELKQFFLKNQTQQCGNIVFHSFDPVVVRLSLDTTNIQHERLTFQLLEPFIEGFSIKSEKMDTTENSGASTEVPLPKRKTPEIQSAKQKKKKK